MRVSDIAFQYAFSNLFVYSILWEDTEVDERYFGIDENSRVLGIAGAGCGLATMLSRHPKRIDAVDINRHHLALTGLKLAAARESRSFSTFYDLFGRGWAPNPRETTGHLSAKLPGWMAQYWERNSKVFAGTALQEGMTARVLRQLRHLVGLDASWLRKMIGFGVEQRMAHIEEVCGPVFRRPEVSFFLNSPLHLLSMGINYEQRDRIVRTERKSMADYLVEHLKKVAATDLRTNWFAWYSVAGHFDHETPEAVPPYLRKDRFEASREAPTETTFRNGNLFDALENGSSNTWTHSSLCDMPDWLPAAAQRKLLEEILRTSRDGALVLCRTVEDDCLAERHGMGRRFRLLAERSKNATEQDRSRQYRHVRFYEVAH